MCIGTKYGEGAIMYKEVFHPSIQHLYKKESFCVDDCIAAEIKELLSKGVATYGLSCCGHGEYQSHAYIFDESSEKASNLGYKVRDFQLMTGEKVKGIHLKTGTQMEELHK